MRALISGLPNSPICFYHRLFRQQQCTIIASLELEQIFSFMGGHELASETRLQDVYFGGNSLHSMALTTPWKEAVSSTDSGFDLSAY